MRISERRRTLILLVAVAVMVTVNLILLWWHISLESQISALREQVRQLLEKLYVKGPF